MSDPEVYCSGACVNAQVISCWDDFANFEV